MDSYSQSSMVKFMSNAFMFKIFYILKLQIDTTNGISGVIGTAFHKAMEVYYGGSDTLIVSNESEAIEYGLRVGMEFLEAYNDGYIEYSKTIPNKEKAKSILAFTYQEYVKYAVWGSEKIIGLEEDITARIDINWRGKKLELPVKLTGRLDKIIEEDEKIKIVDYKTCRSFSDLDKIDGKKIIQAVQYYLLAYVKYGREPYSVIFQEIKTTKNQEKNKPQVREYEMVFKDNELYFDFYFRVYEDMTRALNGEMVYVPNLDTFYDNEVGIISYIHRLDIPEEQAKLQKKLQVDNITDVLKKQIQNTGSMRKLLKSVEEKFSTAKNIDYTKMKTEEKIQTKLMEHGMLIRYDSVVSGTTVDLYRFSPSIGIKMSKIQTFTADVEQVLGATNVRILAPIPGTSLIGFEVPREYRTFPGNPSKAKELNVPIGVDINGEIQYIDIQKAPHILVAGTTGSGKTETLRAILNSIEGNANVWIADPKGNEFLDIPNQRHEEDPEKIREMIEDAVDIMEERFQEMKSKKQRDYQGKPLIVLVDEFGDFILNNLEGTKKINYNSWTKSRLENACKSKGIKLNKISSNSKQYMIDILEDYDEQNMGKYSEMSAEELIIKISQKGRSAGVHLIIATQSPRATVITGRIKANIPTRIALRTSSELESRIILDIPGAEKLLGKGDMLLMKSDSSDIIRLQGYKYA